MAEIAPKKFITTEAGECAFPKLDKPDNEKFGGDYKVRLVLPIEKAKGLVAQLKEVLNQNYPPAKLKGKVSTPWTVKKEEGVVEFLFRSDYKPILADVQGNKIERDLKVGGGSVIKCKIGVRPFSPKSDKVGIKAMLYGVQIIKLVEYKGAGGAGSGGFGDASKELGAGEHGFVAAELITEEAYEAAEAPAPQAKAPKVVVEDDLFDIDAGFEGNEAGGNDPLDF